VVLQQGIRPNSVIWYSSDDNSQAKQFLNDKQEILLTELDSFQDDRYLLSGGR
jgi:hypothetical protein